MTTCGFWALAVGSQRYGTSFGGAATFEIGKKLKANNAPGPANCAGR